MRFFFYGTLMDRDLLEAVIGRKVKNAALSPAVLRGYRKVSLRGRAYPAALAMERSSIRGVLFSRATTRDFMRLNAYEDDGYELARVGVHGKGRTMVHAFLFAAEPGAYAISRKPWSLKNWRRRHKADALAWLSSIHWLQTRKRP